MIVNLFAALEVGADDGILLAAWSYAQAGCFLVVGLASQREFGDLDVHLVGLHNDVFSADQVHFGHLQGLCAFTSQAIMNLAHDK